MSKIKILNSDFEYLGLLDGVVKANRKEVINSDNTLDFSTTLHDSKAALIDHNSIIELDEDYFDVAWYKKTKQAKGEIVIDVDCEHISYRLNDPAYDKDYFTEMGTPTYILGKILEGTGFTVGTVEFEDVITYSAQEKKSRRGLLMEFAQYVGGELLFDAFEISLLAQRGSATPVDLVAGKNIAILGKEVNKRQLDALGNPTIAYSCGLIGPIELNLGDAVYISNAKLDVDVTLRVVSLITNPYKTWEVIVEIGNTIPGTEDELYKIQTTTISKDKTYNGIRIGPDTGFEAVRNDNKARAYFNSTNLAMQAGDGEGNWTNKLYYDFDSETGEATLVFDGKLSAEMIEALEAEFDVTVSNTMITNVLAADKGYIAELTVDQLETSDKVQKYLAEDTSDVDYIKIKDQYVEFITASTDGSAYEQATDRHGTPLYWRDSTKDAVTTDNTGIPVRIYVYDEAVKLKMSFQPDGGYNVPIIELGQGDGVTENSAKAIIKKGQTGLEITYYTSNTAKEVNIQLSDEGFVDADMRRLKSASIDRTAGTVEVLTEGKTIGDEVTISFVEGTDTITYTWPDSFTTTISIV
jgi:hypothetical protein